MNQSPFANICHEQDAPASVSEAQLTSTWKADTWQNGLQAEPRQLGPAENSLLATFLIAIVVLITYNIDHCRRLLRTFPQDLIGVRQRSNAFDEHTTGETWTYVFIIMLLCISEGIMMLTLATSRGTTVSNGEVMTLTLAFSTLAMVFYVVQLGVYRIVGYTFADKNGATQWVRGFNASQALLSFLLIVPALLSLIYPSSATLTLPMAAIMYVTVRILFIYKGFRIFFDNISSLLYFILYLCTLEITPLFVLAGLASGIVNNFN